MEYLKRIEKPNTDMLWNIPEQAHGQINVIGGNAQNFRTPVKLAEYLSANYPLKTVNLVLPDALTDKLPPLPNLIFLKSTDSGSLANGDEIIATSDMADYNIIIGDLSKNSITEKALEKACHEIKKPVIVTRDAVDLLASSVAEPTLMNENLIIMGSMIQLQKLFRAVYYPKMLLLTAPINNIVEILHKFTLSYPVSLITIYNNQVLVAKDGEINIVALEKTGYSPISFWGGELVAKIAAINLYNPSNFLKATTSALISAQS